MTQKFAFGATGLIGGTDNDLDHHSYQILNDGDVASVITDFGVYHYHYNASSAASENSPYTIVPDDLVGTGAWELVVPQGAFSHVEATVSGGTISTASLTTIVFSSEVKDTLGEYNPATGGFTAKYTGRYLVCAAMRFTSASWSAVGNEASFRAYVDAAEDARGVYFYTPTTSSFRGSFGFSKSIDLVAGEVLTLRVYHNAGTDRTIDVAWLTIDRIA